MTDPDDRPGVITFPPLIPTAAILAAVALHLLIPLPFPAPLAVRWLVQFARGRREKSMAERLANEVLDATQQQGGAWKRKDDIYRMAQANKAFAHYRW